MKRLLTILLLLPVFLQAQTFIGRQQVDSFPSDQFGDQLYGLDWFPPGYTTSGLKYPLIIHLHGSGEAGTGVSGLNKLLVSTSPVTLPYRISNGFNPAAVNPKTRVLTQFIVISPQNSSWSCLYDQLRYILPSILSRYRTYIDTTRIYLTGYSAGGDGTLTCLGADTTFAKYFAAAATASAADVDGSNTVPINDVATIANFRYYTKGGKRGFWGVVGDQDTRHTYLYVDSFNVTAPVPAAKYTLLLNVGHSAWQQMYDSAFRPKGNYYGNHAEGFASQPNNNGSAVEGTGTTEDSLNMYEWMLLYSAAGPGGGGGGGTGPVANAGSPQSITLPTSSLTLDGSGSTGTITSYSWTEVSGPVTATITSPSSVSTTVTGMTTAGSYTFRLSLNGGASTSTVVETVSLPSGQYPACGSGTKYNITANADTGWVYDGSLNTTYKPGDTLVFANSAGVPRWVYINLNNFRGNPACPLVMTYSGTQTLVENLSGDTTRGHNGTIDIEGCAYVKVDGNHGDTTKFGFLVQGDPVFRYNLGAAVQIADSSHNVEVCGVKIRNIGTGFWSKNNGGCNANENYNHYVLDSIYIDHNWVVGTWNEGMYLGNTSPDNSGSGACAYDQRPIICADTTYYPIPPRNGHFFVYYNRVDSTGRGGIQLAAASSGISQIYGNNISNNGMNGDDAQGTAISTGAYTRAWIYNNNIHNTYTWAIALLGASGTGIPQQIFGNTTDSSGYRSAYNLSTANRMIMNPWTEPMYTDSLAWVQSVFVDTKPTCNPVDSTIVWIKSNTLKLTKQPSQQILIQNDHSTLQLTGGNIICGNVTGSGGAVSIYKDPNAAGFVYSTSCAITPPSKCGNCITAPLNIKFPGH